MIQVGNRIKAIRKDADLTLEELAAEIGVSRQTLSRYETGVISNIPSDRIEDLARILHTTPAYLMGWDSITGTHGDTNNINKEFPISEEATKFAEMDEEEELIRTFKRFISGKSERELQTIKDFLALLAK